jgi:hypothetical protein
VSDATAASDTAQKIGFFLSFVRCRMQLLHPTLNITVCVNTLLKSLKNNCLKRSTGLAMTFKAMPMLLQGSMLRSQLSAIFANF